MIHRAESRCARPARVAVATFGCKLNQWDTQDMLRRAAAYYDIVDFDAEADLYVVNTCTVTAGSDGQARQLIRRTIRRHPEAKVLVTGCYAERARDELMSIRGVTDVVGNDAKESFPDLLHRYVDGHAGEGGKAGADLSGAAPTSAAVDGGRVAGSAGTAGRTSEAGVSTAAWRDDGAYLVESPVFRRSRAQVAVQRGCDRECTYCIVPSVRGPSRSYGPDRVIEEVAALLDAGFREIVLTGTYLGDYGTDLDLGVDLPELIRILDRVIDGSARLRISSLGPCDITEKLVECIADCRNVCRHVHVAFQSGDDGVLRAMGRGDDGLRLRRALELLVDAFEGFGLGGDVMVGFPGEDEKAFANTVGVVDDFPFSYLHVFVFSPRPGTAAQRLGDSVHPRVARDRSRKLRSLCAEKGLEFAGRFVGRRVKVIAEGVAKGNGLIEGTSEEYLRVLFEGDDNCKGRLLPVDVSGVLSARTVLGRKPAN